MRITRVFIDATRTEESEEYPLYRYEDEMAARKIGRAGRAYIARRVLFTLRRDHRRCAGRRQLRGYFVHTGRVLQLGDPGRFVGGEGGQM